MFDIKIFLPCSLRCGRGSIEEAVREEAISQSISSSFEEGGENMRMAFRVNQITMVTGRGTVIKLTK